MFGRLRKLNVTTLALGSVLFIGGTYGASAAETPVPPSDPVAAGAFKVLQTACARCHQDGMLVNREKPAKNFGNVLLLDQIARDGHLIVPGNPDGSPILKQIVDGKMPDDGNYNLNAYVPTDEDVAALRTWIAALGQSAACTPKPFITEIDAIQAMAADLGKLPRTRVADTRYLSLVNLHNTCSSDEAMNVYRQGAVKLLNSLSSSPDVVRLETIEPTGSILRINLRDLGWTPQDWDKILSAYPYGAKVDTPAFDFVNGTMLTSLGYVRADWFAFAASQPPLYNALLKLPTTFAGLTQSLNLNLSRDIDSFQVKRAGFQKSGVSRNNRLIERHQISTGYFWTSYDFAGTAGKQNLFDFPLGPGPGQFAFEHAGGESIWRLPNGFQAYYLNTADGKSLDKGPTTIVLDPIRRDQSVTNGISCIGCHNVGIKMAVDEIRPKIARDLTFPKSARDVVEALYPVANEMEAVLKADLDSFQSAMRRAGLEPGLQLNGVEMTNALFQRYENDVDLTYAAADFGMTADEFIKAIQQGNAPRLLRRLAQQEPVPRDVFEAQFRAALETVSFNSTAMDFSKLSVGPKIVVAKPNDRPVEVAKNFDIAVTSDRFDYRVNDTPVFTVSTSRECYLTLIDVDPKNVATVIFPNRFQQDNRIFPGRDIVLPPAGAGYRYRLDAPGFETVIAICSTDSKPVENIQYNFNQNAFTDIGNINNHTRSVVRSQAQTRAIRVEENARVNGPGVAPTPKPTDTVVARTAIKLGVK
ncbi:MAG: DUF4384 domain-containing protein [Bauldia sp.]